MLCALFAGVFRYADQHFHTPETFLENTSELANNADIRERLLNGFRDEIIAFADELEGGPVEEESTGFDLNIEEEDDALAEVLDPVTQARNDRNQAVDDILLSVFDTGGIYADDYYAAFNEALAQTQLETVAAAELQPEELLNDKGEVFFNIRRLYQQIWPELATNELTASLTVNEPPAQYGIYKVADRDTTVNFLWTLIRNAPSLRSLTTAAAVLALIAAVVIAERRPSTAIQFGGGLVGVGVVVIVIVFLIRFVVPLLAGGGSSASPVVATYTVNTSPLVSGMIRLVILGVVLAIVGGIAKLIWPDDWVYGSVSDDRGVRSIMRRRGAPEPQAQPQQQQPAAAATPVGYPGYGQPPYPGYPQQWGQPYPGQYPPGYGGYPAGPYAQPAQPMPQQPQSQHYASPGKPTVPVMPVNTSTAAAELVPPAAPPLDAAPGDLPADAAQVVPRVVATTNAPVAEPKANEAAAQPAPQSSEARTPETPAAQTPAGQTPAAQTPAPATDAPVAVNDAEPIEPDEWASEKDW